MFRGGRIAAATNHVFRAAKFQKPPAYFLISAAHRLDDAPDRNAISLQPVGIYVHLELPRVSPDRRHLSDPRYRTQVIAEIPILVGAQIRQAVFPGRIDQRVLVDPAERRRIRAKFGLHPLWQTGNDAREILHDSRARPVQIRSVLEDDVHVGIAEIGDAAHRLHFRRAQHGGHDGIRDLILNDVGAAVPARINDDLGIAKIRGGVQRNSQHRPASKNAGERY